MDTVIKSYHCLRYDGLFPGIPGFKTSEPFPSQCRQFEFVFSQPTIIFWHNLLLYDEKCAYPDKLSSEHGWEMDILSEDHNLICDKYTALATDENGVVDYDAVDYDAMSQE